MRVFHHDALKELMAHEQGPAVSIYLPTQPIAPLTNDQDRLRFKNALDQAAFRLQDFAVAPGNVDLILGPARQLLDDNRFWHHQNKGLAVFLAPDFFRAYRLPLDFDEHVLVQGHFHIPPLMPFFEGMHPFFILALSQHEVKLFKADKLEIQQVPKAELPHSIEEVLADFQFSQEQRHVTSAGRGTGIVQQGEDTFTHKEQLATFCQRIDQALQDMLQATKSPLVLAGVDYVCAIYRQVSHYPLIMPRQISGNPVHTAPKALHRQALEIVEPVLAKEHAAAIAHFAELTDTDRVVCKIPDVVRAAYGSQIETLFLMREAGPSGQIGLEGQVEIHADHQMLAEDLVNLATLYTLRSGGQVLTVTPDELQQAVPAGFRAGSELAAILRW